MNKLTDLNYPKITIITPTLNQGKFIEETINSVLNQKYPNLEYIIIDGGSTDETHDIIRKYENKITHWVSEPDSGQSDAINKGISCASGDIIAWLNSDDVYLENCLANVAKAYNNSNSQLIYGQCIPFKGDKNFGKWWESYPDDLYCLIGGSPFPPQPSTFYTKKLFDEQGKLDTALHYSMDYDIFIRAILNYKVENIATPLSKFRLHSNSKSGSQSIQFRHDRRKVYRKILNSFASGQNIISELEHLGLSYSTDETFNVSKNLTETDLFNTLPYFLNNQIHHYYNSLEIKQAKQLISYVQKNHPKEYEKLKLKPLQNRMTLLGKSGVKLMRTLFR